MSLTAFLDKSFRGRRVHKLDGPLTDAVQRFIDLPADTRNGFDLITGHQSLGIHRYIERPVKYLTILRDPVERLLSSHFFTLAKGDAAVVLPEAVAALERQIGDFKSRGLDNFYTRLLKGEPGDFEGGKTDLDVGAVNEEHYLQALQNLEERFAFVGVTETMWQNTAVLSALFGGTPFPRAARVNVTKIRVDRAHVSREAIDAFVAANTYDFRLYNHARERLRRDWVRMNGFRKTAARLIRWF